MDANQLSPKGAFVMGALFVASGLMPILMSLGVITPTNATPGTPAWVGFCAGLLFVVAGFTIMLDYGVAGGVGPDGDLKAGTPFAIRVANLILGLTIVGLMTAVFGWVAFGSGPRAFSTSISLPFFFSTRASGELSGRIAFGAGTVLLALMFVACGVTGAKKLISFHASG